MVRENRVKDEAFALATVLLSGTSLGTGSNFNTVWLPHVINGEILKIGLYNVLSNGSLTIFESGTNTIVYQNLAQPVSTNTEVYPRVFNLMTNGTTGSPYIASNLVTNNILGMNGSGFHQGSGIGPVVIYYR